MGKFKKIEKDGFFIWQNNEVKLVFSDMKMQPYEELSYVKGFNDIMHLYYTVAIVTKENYTWKTVAQRNVYDFPTLTVLFDNLETILNKNIDINDYSCHTAYNFKKEVTGHWFEYRLTTESFLNDDTYIVTKTIYQDAKTGEVLENYGFYAGCSIDIQGGRNSKGFYLYNLEKKDLECLYQLVKDFIAYGIAEYNKWAKEYILETLGKFVSDGKCLYKMKDDGTVLNVFRKGMYVNAEVLLGSLDSQDYRDEYIAGFYIDDIRPDEIVLKGKKSAHRRVYFKELINLIKEFDEEQERTILAFDEEAVINDFMTIITDKDKKEFAEKDVDFLYNKWKEALINCYWLCRDEHNLKTRAIDDGNHENVYAAVKYITGQIKRLCENENI